MGLPVLLVTHLPVVAAKDFFEESTSTLINDLIGGVRQLVEDLLEAGPRLQFFKDTIWPMELAAETKAAIHIHNQELIALRKERSKSTLGKKNWAQTQNGSFS